MAMTGAGIFREPGNDHIRPETTYYPDNVGQDFFFIPELKGFFSTF
jgi:hypothetical protein